MHSRVKFEADWTSRPTAASIWRGSQISQVVKSRLSPPSYEFIVGHYTGTIFVQVLDDLLQLLRGEGFPEVDSDALELGDVDGPRAVFVVVIECFAQLVLLLGGQMARLGSWWE